MSRQTFRFPFIGLIFLALVLYFFRASILEWSAKVLIEEDPISKGDAIFVLSGEFPGRILEAADLYREGYAPLVYLSRDEEPSAYAELRRRKISAEVAPSGNDLKVKVMEALGVPKDKIIQPLQPMKRTVDEARYIASVTKEKKDLRDLIVVTSPAHTARAKRLLATALAGTNVQVHMRSTRFEKIEPKGWWKDNLQRRAVGHEWLALLAAPFIEKSDK